MNDGFASKGLVGQNLSFEGVFGRLIGKEAPKFFERLKVLRDIGLRQYQDLGTAARQQVKEELTNPGINYLKRFFIPPLTTFGRKVTALESLIGRRNLRFVSTVMMDDALFRGYVGAITNRKGMKNFIQLLYTYNMNWSNDIANQLEMYDEREKKQYKYKSEKFKGENTLDNIEQTIRDVIPPLSNRNKSIEELIMDEGYQGENN